MNCSEENCSLEVFQNEQFILHCNKESWYSIQDSSIFGKNQKILTMKQCKIDLFWNTFIEKYSKIENKEIKIERVHFPTSKETPFLFSQVLEKLSPNTILLSECRFYDNTIITSYEQNKFTLQQLKVVNTFVEGELYITNVKFDNIYITDCNIPSLKIQMSLIENLNIFGNKENERFIRNINIAGSKISNFFKFQDLELETLYLNDTSIKNTILKNLLIKNQFNLENTTFETRLDFYNVEYKNTINLESAKIPDETNFEEFKFDIDLKTISRKTARQIKHSFEKIGNKIDANKFHSIELNARENELKKNFYINLENLLSFLVFFFHGLTSRHSRDFLLPLLWIISVSMYTYIGFTIEKIFGFNILFIFLFFHIILFLIVFWINYKYLVAITSICIAILFFRFMGLDFSSENILKFTNILNQKIFEEKFSLVLFVNKILLGYLYYQFITAVRKDTSK
ncbi:hypothetical protein Q6A91_05625 [Aliarcobacter skirrowii]|uniref:hypothetical protein n=1 Tax=Aliarcobacter skirrowii TaxID=28200 RepID=UPI0029BA6770|nr:hypothetical protein [Aliarcobacter skirrowii]MDX4065499.1 hypothetical protein [Aliarcobacter skirrowii]